MDAPIVNILVRKFIKNTLDYYRPIRREVRFQYLYNRTRNTKMANFTEDGNASSTLTQTSIFSAGTGIFLFAINISLSFTAFLGNALILIALPQVSSLHTPSKLLFGCLAVTDLGVGLISQPLFAISILSYVTEINLNIHVFASKVHRASSLILCQVSMFVSTAISVDRLLALLLGLRYRHLVTLKRVRAVIYCFWFISVSIMFIQLFLSFFVASITAEVLVVLCLVISLSSYTKIFLTLRQQQAQVQAHLQGQPNRGESTLNIARYKKTVSSIAWVQLALVACYVPFVVCNIIAKLSGFRDSDRIALNCISTLLYLTSSLNPLLYCWKMGELRKAVTVTIRQFCC